MKLFVALILLASIAAVLAQNATSVPEPAPGTTTTTPPTTTTVPEPASTATTTTTTSSGPNMVSPVIDNDWSAWGYGGDNVVAATSYTPYSSYTPYDSVFNNNNNNPTIFTCVHPACPTSDPCAHPECPDPVSEDEVRGSKRKDKKALKEEKKVEQWLENVQRRLKKADEAIKKHNFTSARRTARHVQKSLQTLSEKIAKYQHRNAVRSQLGRNVDYVVQKLNSDVEKLQVLANQASNILFEVERETGYDACAHPSCPSSTPVCPHRECPAASVQALCYHPQCPDSMPYCPHPDCHTLKKMLKHLEKKYNHLNKRYYKMKDQFTAAWLKLAKQKNYKKKAVLKERKRQLYKGKRFKNKVLRVMGRVRSIENSVQSDRVLTLRENLVALLKKVKTLLRRLLRMKGGRSTRLALAKLLLADAKRRLAAAKKKEAELNKAIGQKPAAQLKQEVSNTTKSVNTANKAVQEVQALLSNTKNSSSSTPEELAALKAQANKLTGTVAKVADRAIAVKEAVKQGQPSSAIPSAPAAAATSTPVASAVANAAQQLKRHALSGRVAKLEAEVAKLKQDVNTLKSKQSPLGAQF